jgi:hypothetical protein
MGKKDKKKRRVNPELEGLILPTFGNKKREVKSDKKSHKKDGRNSGDNSKKKWVPKQGWQDFYIEKKLKDRLKKFTGGPEEITAKR